MLDLLLINGRYPDFTDVEIKPANIGVCDGKISYIGSDKPEAAKVIDVKNSVISPGFLDIHMHEEDFIKEGNDYVIADMMLNMGVTTALGGNCGIQIQRISKFREVIQENGGSPINYAMLAGYNECRYILGMERLATADDKQRQQIRDLLKKELDDGAFGISFGIEYDPGITEDEILYGIGVSDDPDILVAAHLRSSCDVDISPIEEAIDIASKIPMKFQISHLSSCALKGFMGEALEAINDAIDKNDKLNYDTYPYDAFSSYIGSEAFSDEYIGSWGKEFSDILLTDEPYKNVRCTEELFKKVRDEYPGMLAVGFAMDEDEIRQAITNRYGMVASDAIINDGKGHPRAAGTFPRVLGKYVRNEDALSLIRAIEKMTKMPADRLCLYKKGRIEEGCDADLTVFNPDTVNDGATYMDLHIKPSGIDYVIVDGQVAIDHGETVNNRLGRFIAFRETK